jgi:hypothetical protein
VRPSPARPMTKPLPRRLQPFPDETAESYLDRVAGANFLETRNLRTCLARERRAEVGGSDDRGSSE